MKTRRRLIGEGLALTFGAGLAGCATPPETSSTSGPLHSFKPGQIWLDTAGKPIQAHGGSIIVVDDAFYWYGENKEFTTGQSDVWTWGVRCYRSTDLYNWHDLGLIIPPNTEDRTSSLHPAAGLDRPHILFNPRTRKFVCWFKILKGTNQTRTVLTADAITGPYTIVRDGILPFGMSAGDFDLAADPETGKAYMYFEHVHTEMICADLTDDYTDFAGPHTSHFPHPGPPSTREGPAFFRRHNKYYLASSGTTSYFPNPSEIAVADGYHGPFTVVGNLHPNDRSRTSFNSQICSVFKHPRKRDLYIALADRWAPSLSGEKFESGDLERIVEAVIQPHRSQLSPEDGAALGPYIGALTTRLNTSLSRYVWLPMRFEGERPFIEWRDEWRLDEFH